MHISRDLLNVVVVSMAAACVLCYTESDVEECGRQQFGSVSCTSLNYFYRECPVPEAEIIYLIKLHENLSNNRCEFTSTFGFRGNAIWVTRGCSGVFYLCYDGDPMSTKRPIATVKPGDNSGQSTPEIQRASTVSDKDVFIYIIVASCVVLLVGIGLLVGCIVKRRQQDDTSRHLAEKRQVRIALREHMEDQEENNHNITLPLATRSLSLESVRERDYDKEGSEYSGRSSNSGMTSVSAQIINSSSGMSRGRPELRSMRSNVSYVPTGRLKKGYSTPDIHALGRMYCDANMLNRHSRLSVARSSQSSLNSIREVCNKYQIFDIPLERRLKQQTRRSVKFDTTTAAGFTSRATRRCSDQTLQAHRSTTRAIVHAPSPSFDSSHLSRSSSIKSNKSTRSTRSTQSSSKMYLSEYEPPRAIIYEHPQPRDIKARPSNTNVQQEQYSLQQTPSKPYQHVNMISGNDVISHYHDPDSLRIQRKPSVKQKPVLLEAKPRVTIISDSTNSIYSKVVKPVKAPKPVIKLPRPQILYPKPVLVKHSNGNNIYATVNKSMFKVTSTMNIGGSVPTPNITRPVTFVSARIENPVTVTPDYEDVTHEVTQHQSAHLIQNGAAETVRDVHNGLDNEGFTNDNHGFAKDTQDFPNDNQGITKDNQAITKDCAVYRMEDDEDDVMSQEKDNMYARMATFKPISQHPYYIHGHTLSTSHI